MPPKKASSKAKPAANRVSKPATKRKPAPTASSPSKSSRKSTRTSTKPTESSKPPPAVAPAQLLRYMLSQPCRAHTTPKDEHAAISSDGSLRSYTNTIPLTPFEEVLSALILSRPISHALGQRSIRTLLNPPYSFNTPKAILDAGPEKVHQSLFAARTQHKGKTAEQIGLLAEVVADKFAAGGSEDDQSLGRLRSQVNGDTEMMVKVLSREVKGMGQTAGSIFLRRIQAVWGECFPYMDQRTGQSLEKLGLPSDPDKLVEVIESSWAELNTENINGGDEEEKKRIAFTVILDRAIGADLNGGIESLLQEAGNDPNGSEQETDEEEDNNEGIRSFDLSMFRYQ